MRSRVHRRVYMDYIGVKRFDADGQPGRRVPHRRPVHLDRLYAPLDPLDPLSAPQGRRRAQARRLRSRQPFRQGAGQRAGDLSARRAVPDRRGHAVPLRAGDPAARRAAARARAGAARPLRPLRLGARSTCRATATTATCARRSATISPRPTRATSAPSIRSFPKGRWCACTSSSAARGRDAEPRPRDAGARGRRRSCAPGPTASPEALARRTIRARRRRCSRAIATPSRTAIARPIRRSSRSATSA